MRVQQWHWVHTGYSIGAAYWYRGTCGSYVTRPDGNRLVWLTENEICALNGDGCMVCEVRFSEVYAVSAGITIDSSSMSQFVR